MAAILNFRIFTKNAQTQMKQGLVRLLYNCFKNVHGLDITNDNVCSSMLSCFFAYVAATLNRASYF